MIWVARYVGSDSTTLGPTALDPSEEVPSEARTFGHASHLRGLYTTRLENGSHLTGGAQWRSTGASYRGGTGMGSAAAGSPTGPLGAAEGC